METQHELTAEALTHELPTEAPVSAHTPTGTYALARIISQVLHPMLFSTLSFMIVGFFALSSWIVGIGWALFIIAIQIIPVVIFYTIRLRQGVYSDEDVSVRQQRNELYFFSMVVLLVGIEVLLLMQAPVPFVALLSSAGLLAVIGWVINLYWKISVHASSAASCTAVAFLYAPVLGGVLAVGALLVGWSRIQTANHTMLQVLAGYGVAVVCVWYAFALFGLV
jgi:membrane-associated phospholipid phosphatase